MENSGYQIKVKLYQQTPMIHFQCDADGAALRGSDVKPKLDQFILMQLGGWEKAYGNQDYKEWFISEDRPALNYKVKIAAPKGGCKAVGSGKAIAPSFFGNMGVRELSEQKKTLFYTEPMVMTITCFIPGLMEYIIKGCWGESCNIEENNYPNLRRFFYVTGFGTRSNKGFGGFSTERTHNPSRVLEDIAQVMNKYNVPNVYYIDYTGKTEPDYQKACENRGSKRNCNCGSCRTRKDHGGVNPQNIEVFTALNSGSRMVDTNAVRRQYLETWSQMLHIAQLYQLLKTGYNRTWYDRDGYMNQHYARAYIFYKFRERNPNVGNEKAWMKREEYTTIDTETDRAPYRNTSIAPIVESSDKAYGAYKYVRAILGSGDQIEFIPIRIYREGNETFREYNTPSRENRVEKVKVKVDSVKPNDAGKSGSVARVPSPIVFRVIGRTTYILPFEQKSEVFDKEFRFTRLGQLTGYDNRDKNLETSGTIKTLGSKDMTVADLMASFAQYINSRGIDRDREPYGENSSALSRMNFSTIFRIFPEPDTIIRSKPCSNATGGAAK